MNNLGDCLFHIVQQGARVKGRHCQEFTIIWTHSLKRICFCSSSSSTLQPSLSFLRSHFVVIRVPRRVRTPKFVASPSARPWPRRRNFASCPKPRYAMPSDTLVLPGASESRASVVAAATPLPSCLPLMLKWNEHQTAIFRRFAGWRWRVSKRALKTGEGCFCAMDFMTL